MIASEFGRQLIKYAAPAGGTWARSIPQTAASIGRYMATVPSKILRGIRNVAGRRFQSGATGTAHTPADVSPSPMLPPASTAAPKAQPSTRRMPPSPGRPQATTVIGPEGTPVPRHTPAATRTAGGADALVSWPSDVGESHQAFHKGIGHNSTAFFEAPLPKKNVRAKPGLPGTTQLAQSPATHGAENIKDVQATGIPDEQAKTATEDQPGQLRTLLGMGGTAARYTAGALGAKLLWDQVHPKP